jgi:hypothetical protein
MAKATKTTDEILEVLQKRVTLAVAIMGVGVAVVVPVVLWLATQWVALSSKISTQGETIAAIGTDLTSLKDIASKQHDSSERLRQEIVTLSSKAGLIDSIHSEAREASKVATQTAIDSKAAAAGLESIRKELERVQSAITQAESKLLPLKDIGKDVTETRTLTTLLNQRTLPQNRQIARIPIRVKADGHSVSISGKFTVTDIPVPFADIPILTKAEATRGLEVVSVELRSKHLPEEMLNKFSVIPLVNEREEKVVLSLWCLTAERPEKIGDDLQFVLLVSWSGP